MVNQEDTYGVLLSERMKTLTSLVLSVAMVIFTVSSVMGEEVTPDAGEVNCMESEEGEYISYEGLAELMESTDTSSNTQSMDKIPLELIENISKNWVSMIENLNAPQVILLSGKMKDYVVLCNRAVGFGCQKFACVDSTAYQKDKASGVFVEVLYKDKGTVSDGDLKALAISKNIVDSINNRATELGFKFAPKKIMA